MLLFLLFLVPKCFLMLWKWVFPPKLTMNGKNVVITGGSSGLGFALAKEYIQNGAKITLIARNLEKLKIAAENLQSLTKDPNTIRIISCDVSNYKATEKAIHDIQSIDHLICCAGICKPGYLIDQSVEDVTETMSINYFGTYNIIKAALPSMIENAKKIQLKKEKPRIVFISSALGLLSFSGQSSYSSSKYALRGLAEALYNELQPYGIYVHAYFPGNIDTPCYAEEVRLSPDITKEIEGSSVVSTPESVANCLLKGMAKGQYAITNEPLLSALRIVGNGVMPRNDTILELTFLPFLAVIGYFYEIHMNYLSRNHKVSKESQYKELDTRGNN